MMPRRSTTRAVLAAMLLFGSLGVAAVVAAPAAAQAEPPVTATGWWSDRVLAREKGEGGIEVARTLDGDSVAALTIESGGAVSSAVITLTEVETGTVRGDSAVIDVCDTGPFVAADPGPIADAPATECAGGVALERSDDGTWTGDISAIVGESTTFLAIVPGPVPDDATPLDPGFVLEFEAPVVALTLGPADDDGASPVVPVDTIAPTPDFSAPPPSDSFDFSPTPSPSFESPPIDSAPVTTVAPPVDSSTSESTEVAGPTLNSAPISGGSGETKPWIRLLLLVPLSAGAGAAAVFGRRRLTPAAA